jgi:hypothetical protein
MPLLVPEVASSYVSEMPRIRVVRYKKRYMTKAVYHYKRYLFHLPIRIGDKVDLSVDYDVQFHDPIIVLVPKSHVNIKNQLMNGQELKLESAPIEQQSTE